MPHLILLVGPPGSGKSTAAHSLIHDNGLATVYINQDTQGKDHLKLFQESIIAHKDVVVDRMNFSKGQRARYLDPAKAAGYHTKIIVLHQPKKVCFDRCMTRENHPTIKDAKAASSALNTFFSKYERPDKDEADDVAFVYPEGDKPLATIIDLDGTLCDLSNRLHHVRKPPGEKKNWKAFFEELVNDKPHEWCAELVNAMSRKYTVVFASGRPDDYESQTRGWLDRYGFSTKHLYMRCRGDHRQDYIAKEIILDFEILTRFTPLFFVDDRKQVVDFWRSRGYTCLACQEGDF